MGLETRTLFRLDNRVRADEDAEENAVRAMASQEMAKPKGTAKRRSL